MMLNSGETLREVSATIQFQVFGRPQQRGSKTPWIPKRGDGSMVMKNGRPVIAMMDSNKNSKAWMTQVRDSAASVMAGRELMTGAIQVRVVFCFARPKSHFGSGKNSDQLKQSSPHFHIQMPDVDKLTRCLLDGCTGIVWRDDSQVYSVNATRMWTIQQERADVTIVEM